MKTELATALIFLIAALVFALGGPIERFLVALFFGPPIALSPYYIIYRSRSARHSAVVTHVRS